MNNYVVKIGALVFTNDSIDSLPEYNSVDLIGSTLAVDECEIVVISESNTIFNNIARATPVEIYRNEALHSKYYFISVEREGTLRYRISACSGIGLLSNTYHKGGMWIQRDNVRFIDIVKDIVGGTIGSKNANNLYPITGGMFNLFVESSLANVIVTGHLPYVIARENLHWLLISYGASLTKSSNGDIILSYLVDNQNPETIPDNNLYNSGSVVSKTPITQVQIEEHTFINRGTLDDSVVAFDSATQGSADNDVIVFSEPYHNLTASGLTIHESNCNYARISGSGTLRGYKYTHSTRLVTKGTAMSKDNVVSLNGVELINPINSTNVANRLYDYYTQGKEVKVDFVHTSEMCGRQYKFKDAIGNTRKGFVSKMDLDTSGIVKANATFVCDYVPSSQGNSYDNAVVLTGSGTWKLPSGKTSFRAILIGGGNGSDGAYDGQAGTRGTITGRDLIWGGSTGGAGGNGTPAADGGKVLIKDITASSGASFSYSCGAGGSGGARNGGKGGAGGNTTFGSYSSANGTQIAGGIVNLFTGEVYAEHGRLDGIAGAKGGDFSGGYPMFSSDNIMYDGDSVTYDGTTYAGGRKGRWAKTGFRTYSESGGGGGAAYGSAGGDAMTYEDAYSGATRGGNGANAKSFPASSYGCGGNGANGGGGGGGGGFEQIGGDTIGTNPAGSGGQGNAGNKGGDGCVIIYY